VCGASAPLFRAAPGRKLLDYALEHIVTSSKLSEGEFSVGWTGPFWQQFGAVAKREVVLNNQGVRAALSPNRSQQEGGFK
jgi:hypothetical protein